MSLVNGSGGWNWWSPGRWLRAGGMMLIAVVTLWLVAPETVAVLAAAGAEAVEVSGVAGAEILPEPETLTAAGAKAVDVCEVAGAETLPEAGTLAEAGAEAAEVSGVAGAGPLVEGGVKAVEAIPVVPQTLGAGETLTAAGTLAAAEGGTGSVPRRGHWSSLLPPILAVVIAISFRSLVAALLGAFLLGGVLRFGWNPFIFLPQSVSVFLLENLLGQFSLYIFGFLFALVGMIHVCYRSGGIPGMVAWLCRYVRGPRSAQLATVGAGLILFFDDYSNCVVVGQAMRGLTDRFRIAREKLAYLVDSTTAPVAGLALISTWIAFEVFLLGETAAALGIETSGYGLFLMMLPMRFYCLGTLLFVVINAGSGRDFGPMLRAMQHAAAGGTTDPDGQDSREMAPASAAPRPLNAVVPLVVVVAGVLVGILLIGRQRLMRAGETFSWGAFGDWQDAFGRAVYDPMLPGGGPGVGPILLWSAVAGGIVAILLPRLQRRMSLRAGARAYLGALPTLWMAVFILTMAWALKTICEELGTSAFLVSLLGDAFPVAFLPMLTYLLAAAMSFAMGTSWGTMGVMIPVMLPLAHVMGGGGVQPDLILLMTAAAVLDGAIFGDHCSPISDTTVLSAISSRCGVMEHVATQLPYALTVMVLTSICGYIPVALGWITPWTFLGLFAAATLVIFHVIGRHSAASQRSGTGACHGSEP